MIFKYVLEKEGRVAVLCGVKHVDSTRSYGEIQQDIDRAMTDGCVLFYEGVRHDPSIKLATRNARRLMTFWSGMIEGGYQYLGDMKGWETQRKNLKYPPDGINADISLENLVNVCDKAEIKCSWPLLYVVSALLIKKPATVSEYPLVLRIVMAIARRRFSAWFEKSFRSLLNKSSPFVTDYRNEAIFRTVADRAGQKNILLLYGISHLTGLLEHFKSDGWRIKQVSKATAD